jgi:hypothetical protein
MKTIMSTLLMALLFSHAAIAQQKTLSKDDEKNMKTLATTDSVGWKRGGVFGLSNTQTYLYQWAAGGNSAVTLTGLVNYFANYRKGNRAWDNQLNMAYGILLQDIDSRAIKIDDRFDYTSKYGRKLSSKWYLAALMNFQTQFAPGYNSVGGQPDYSNKISDLLAPGRLLLGLGLDFKPNSQFSAFLSPTTYRGIFVLDQQLADAGAFGVEDAIDDNGVFTEGTGKNVRNEVGFYARGEYTTKLMENINYTTKLELFANYLDEPQNIDVNWENLIAMKINKYFSFSIATQLIYDHNTILQKKPAVTDEQGNVTAPARIGPGVQFREVASLGFAYQF